jgi:alpha-D-xyloside xylohydrolase
VPVGADIQSTASKQAIAQIKVYPGKDGQFRLYDDDGVSYDYEHGKSSVTLLKWDDAAGKLSASGGDAALVKAAPGLVKLAAPAK